MGVYEEIKDIFDLVKDVLEILFDLPEDGVDEIEDVYEDPDFLTTIDSITTPGNYNQEHFENFHVDLDERPQSRRQGKERHPKRSSPDSRSACGESKKMGGSLKLGSVEYGLVDPRTYQSDLLILSPVHVTQQGSVLHVAVSVNNQGASESAPGQMKVWSIERDERTMSARRASR